MRDAPFYHGTRADYEPGDLIEPDGASSYVYLTPDLDAARWDGEIGPGEGASRVYTVEPTGSVEDATESADWEAPGHPSMAWRSREPLRVTGEVTESPFYHGTRADLEPGDMIEPGQTPNFGDRERTSPWVYLTRTLDAAAWGAELSAGEGRGRVYVVEPTGPIEDDPNVTDQKFRGNPTQSFRSRDPLRITGEVADWPGHSPEAIAAMKEGVQRLEERGIGPIDD